MDSEASGLEEAVPLSTVIGRNARRLRRDAGLTLDKVSMAAKTRGLSWSESRVADFESGRVAPNLATLVAVCLALADAGCSEAALPELLRSNTPIQINDSLFLSSEQVVNLFHTTPPSQPPAVPLTTTLGALEDMGILAELDEISGATEERTRKALGISRTELSEWSAMLWNRSFSEERDRRAGAGANAQKRGQVSRELRKELQVAIEAADGTLLPAAVRKDGGAWRR